MFSGGILMGGLLAMVGWGLAICAVIAVLVWKGGVHVGRWVLRRPTDADRARAAGALHRAVLARVGENTYRPIPEMNADHHREMTRWSAESLANALLHSQEPHEVAGCDRCQKHKGRLARLAEVETYERWSAARQRVEAELAPHFVPVRGRVWDTPAR